jgi:hypothetical protein
VKAAWIKKTAKRTIARACGYVQFAVECEDVTNDAAYQVGDGWGFAERLPRDEDKDGAKEENATEALEEVCKDLLDAVGFRW